MSPGSPPLFAVEDLSASFAGRAVVERVGFTLAAGEALGLVGESGSGKSLTALAALGLSTASVTGHVRLDGRDLLGLSPRELRRVRGAEVGMVFQEPASALDPVFTAGAQVADVLRAHGPLGRGAARRRAVERLAAVGLPDPERVARAYPHELSGGMQQRVLIAMATACRPRVLLADEPTTALDVTVQAQILELLAELQRTHGMGLLLISHDLSVVAGRASRVAVMFAGEIVEEGPTAVLFERPRHPATLELLRARPESLGRRLRGRAQGEGAHPGPAAATLPAADPRALEGCRFRARCPLARDACRASRPAAVEVAPGHRSACLFPEEVPAP